MRIGGADFPEPLLNALHDGPLAVFAGADFSMGPPANLPDFPELARQVAEGTGLSIGQYEAVTQRRTTGDFAHQMRWLVYEAYSNVPVVRLVLDNLNTHRKASLYQTFPAGEARRIARRLEFHYTPKHGSWLNMAEIEFSIFSRSCLRQRLPDEESLRREVHALELERNEAQARINWRFSIQDARTKLHRLYPINTCPTHHFLT